MTADDLFVRDLDLLRSAPSLRWATSSLPDRFCFGIAELDVHVPDFVQSAVLRSLVLNGTGYARTEEFEEGSRRFARQHIGLEQPAALVSCTDALRGCEAVLASIPRRGTVAVEVPLYPELRQAVARACPGSRILDVPASGTDAGALRVWAEADVMVVSNPHNPLGLCWDISRTETLLGLAESAGTVIVVDEVHLPVTGDGVSIVEVAHDSPVPVVGVCSASKAFGLGGMKAAFVYANSAAQSLLLQVPPSHLGRPATLGVAASLGCYRHGDPWLREVRDQLLVNRRVVAEHLTALPFDAEMSGPASSFVGWVSTDLTPAQARGFERALDVACVDVLQAEHFGGARGSGWRMNYGSHPEVLRLGLNQLLEATLEQLDKAG